MKKLRYKHVDVIDTEMKDDGEDYRLPSEAKELDEDKLDEDINEFIRSTELQ